MICSVKNDAQRRFVVRCWRSGVLVAVLAIAAKMAFRWWHLHGVVAYTVAILPALPILWVLSATGAYLTEEKFERTLLAQCLPGGIGGTLATTAVWAYLEDFARAPRLDLIWVKARYR